MVLSNCDIQSLAKSTAALSQTLAHAVQAKTTNANSQVQVNTIRHLSDGTLALDYQCTAVADLEAAKMALNNAVQRDDIKNAIALRTIVVASEAGEKSQQNKSLYTASEPAFKPSKLGGSESTDSDAKHEELKAPKQRASPSPKSDDNHEISRGHNRREGDPSGGEQMREASKAPRPVEYGNPGDDHKGGPLSGPKPSDARHPGDDHNEGPPNGPKLSVAGRPGDDHQGEPAKGPKPLDAGHPGDDHKGGAPSSGPIPGDAGHPGDEHKGGPLSGPKPGDAGHLGDDHKVGLANGPKPSEDALPGDDHNIGASKGRKQVECGLRGGDHDGGEAKGPQGSVHILSDNSKGGGVGRNKMTFDDEYVALQNAQKAWNLILKNGPDAVENEISDMHSKFKGNKSLSSPLDILWANKNNSSPLTLTAAPPVFTSELVKASASALSVESSTPLISCTGSNTQSTIHREGFKQQSVQNELNTVNEQITSLTSLKSTVFWRSDNCKELNGLMKSRSKLKCSINRLKTNQAAQCRMRKNRRLRMTRLLDNHPEIAEEITSIIRHTSGKPSLEESQCGLLGAIMDIANSVVVAADSRRRTDAIQSCLTLDSLKEQFNVRGYQLSRTSTYYRQDDKCRIPLGISAAHKQAPFIMNMKIQIKLPDHDFVIATKHKLIPSVYGACIINDERVSYSGPTFAAIRSGKHDHSSAMAHANDFDTLVQLPKFEIVTLSNGTVKPVVILSVDGGEALSRIWSQLKIDSHPVVSRYIKPLIDNPTGSQYLLQVVRCNKKKCSKPWRSYYFQILNQRFVPAPVAYQVSKLGRVPSRFDENNSNFLNLFERLHLQNCFKHKLMLNFLPFDRYCLSLQQNIQPPLCAICGSYFSSIA
ncbi:unnamed protein product [Rotaria socialis]|uniref:Uncharacterized protein n=1 Tax=Rotaria socialis TaxID=392032 RepID=A0A818JT45_9BILA|nr:unnamed protein product [Rotaria socialis]